MQPVFINGSKTCAFKVLQPVDQWVWQQCGSQDSELFQTTIKKPQLIKQYIERLQNTVGADHIIPLFRPNNYIIAFNNGCLDFEDDLIFTPHEDIGNPEFHASAHWDCDFEDICATDAETPTLDKILHEQDIRGPIYWTFLALVFGRPFYESHLDGWQKIPIIWGVSGSGKSLIGNLLYNMFQVSERAILSNAANARWLAGQVKDARFFFCPEFGDNSSWPKEFVLSITGDTHMPWEKKYCNPGTMEVKQQGLLLSNSGLPWPDTHGELLRRFMPFHFNKNPLVLDSTLQSKLNREKHFILLKGLQSYQNLVRDAESNLDEHLETLVGPYFQSMRTLLIQ